MHIYKYRDIEYQLYGAPVEPYLNKNKIKLEAPSTSNWRGYQGFWRLSADRLYIVKLESANMTFSDVFNTQEEVFAEWYTGSLEIGIGKHKFGFRGAWIYDYYLWIYIESGIIKEKRIIYEIGVGKTDPLTTSGQF
jgi:hypothetical protein